MTTTESKFDASPEARPDGSARESRLDAVFDALASRRCRNLLGRLTDVDDALRVDDLAARLADDATGTPTRLHHTHLPKLDDVGLVDYDADQGLVRSGRTDEFEALRAAIDDAGAADLPIELDALFDLLSNARRRLALRILLAHGDVTLPDLADEVAVAERGRSLPEIDPDDVLQTYLSLYHTHVPKLTGAGVASYDQDGDLIALTDAGSELESTIVALCEAADASESKP